MKKSTILIFLLSTTVVYGMEETLEKPITRKQAQNNTETKHYPFILSKQRRLLNLAKKVDKMTKNEAYNFVSSINTKDQTILKEICCCRNLFWKKNDYTTRVEETDETSYSVAVSGEVGNLKLNFYHKELPDVPIHSLHFPVWDIECTIGSQAFNTLIFYERSMPTRLIGKIPTFEQYLNTKPVKRKHSLLALIISDLRFLLSVGA